MAGQAVIVMYGVIKRISGQTGVSLYGSVAAAVVTQGRCHVALSRGTARSAVQQLWLSAA